MDGEFDDETLMAFADGELSTDAAARVEAAVARDATLAKRVAVMRRVRTVVAENAAATGLPSVPGAIIERARALAAERVDAPVIPIRPPVQRRARALAWQLPIAACLALTVGFGAGIYLRGAGAPLPGLAVASVVGPAVQSALETAPSGERRSLGEGTGLLPIASFHDASGELCREFEIDQPGADTVIAVACHVPEGWSIRVAVATAPTDGETYAPAASVAVLDAYVSSIGAGPLLTTEEEAAALADL